jgi:hypothetical protein
MTNHCARPLLLSISLLLTILFACNKSDFQNPELADHSAEFAFPLFSTSFNLEDLMFKVLNDTLSGDTLFINPDNTMTLYYTGDVAEKPSTDIFKFLEAGLFPLVDSINGAPIQAPAGVTISKARLSSGTMYFTIVSNTTSDTLRGYFYVPQMTKPGGELFKIEFVAPPGQGFATSRDMAGLELNSGSNSLNFNYRAYNESGTQVIIPGPVVVAFNNLKFSFVQGYWGYSVYPLTRDTIEIDINQTDLDGSVTVKNPRITMRISNSWGFPTRGVIKYMSFVGQNGEELKLETTAFTNDWVDFNYPSIVNNEVGQTKYTEIYLDENNSNIAEIFNAQPTRLIYEVEGVSNANQDPSIIGFLTDSSNLKLNMQVELLLEGTANNFGGYDDVDTTKIEAVEFKLVTENGAPITTDLQLFFLDENDNRIDSLFKEGPQPVLRAAPIGAGGISSGATRTENFIPMTTARFDRIRRSKRAFLQTYFTTAENGTVPVKLLATDQMLIKMGIKVKTKF